MADRRLAKALLAQAVALVAPPCCLGCGAPCVAGASVCPACSAELAAMPHGERAPRRGPALATHFAAFPMAGAARSLVHTLKFGGGVSAAAEMARLITERAPAGTFVDALLVPAPAHPLRARERGYNQCALLARELSRLTGAPVSDCLARSAAGPPQTGLPRAARLALGPAAIAPRPGAPLFNEPLARDTTNVLVLDDVSTTGVTLELCASAIGRRTAAPVGAVTFAGASAHESSTGPGAAPPQSPRGRRGRRLRSG